MKNEKGEMLHYLVWYTSNMDFLIFKEILEKLEDINYFFISGLSVAIHTKGKRIPDDIDIAVHPDDIDKFAKKLGTKAHKRDIDKRTFVVDDYGFEVNYKGQMVECTTGYPARRIKENTFNKLFDLKIKTKYQGCVVYVEPVEELVNQKAFMHREKDLNDLELLKNLQLNKELFQELSIDKGNLMEILPVVKSIFNI